VAEIEGLYPKYVISNVFSWMRAVGYVGVYIISLVMHTSSMWHKADRTCPS